MPETDIGCCGAYCGTCRALVDGTCRGCKLGYDAGERDITKARCAMKRCCVAKLGTSRTCADCPEYESCPTLLGFYAKKGYKYKKYREATAFIRRHGYEAFLLNARTWSGAYGRLPAPAGETRKKAT